MISQGDHLANVQQEEQRIPKSLSPEIIPYIANSQQVQHSAIPMSPGTHSMLLKSSDKHTMIPMPWCKARADQEEGSGGRSAKMLPDQLSMIPMSWAYQEEGSGGRRVKRAKGEEARGKA
eukprot:488091-Rhodomonas_salina.1